MANRELFQKLYDQITAQPDSLDMREWLNVGTAGCLYTNPVTGTHGEIRTCDTTRCAFGWISFFEAGPVDPVEWAEGRLWDLIADGTWTEEDAEYHSATTLVGAHCLQIDPEDAEGLFLHTGNDEVVALIRAYADGRIE